MWCRKMSALDISQNLHCLAASTGLGQIWKCPSSLGRGRGTLLAESLRSFLDEIEGDSVRWVGAGVLTVDSHSNWCG